MSVMAVEQSARGRDISIGGVTFYAGRLPWTREHRLQTTRHFADVMLFGRYVGVCWR